MHTTTLEDAQARLPELISRLKPGDSLIITRDAKPVARITAEGSSTRQRPGPGLCKHMITIVADDDDHLKDFAEYMP